MIEILKASAGAGKTYRLVRKYIELLLGSDKNIGQNGTASDMDYVVAYRNILAVTFTNKATQEMKDRIMKELHILSLTPKKSGYYKYLVVNWNTLTGIFEQKVASDSDVSQNYDSMSQERIDLATTQIASLSGKMLYGILHDYGAFSVSTIDKFFQQVLRAFSKEIGYFSAYDIELDKDSLIEESVERILNSVSETDPRGRGLLIWLLESVKYQLNNKQKFNLNKSLTEMAKQLKSDKFKDILEASNVPMTYYNVSEDEKVLYPKNYSKEELKNIRKFLKEEVIRKFEQKISDICTDIIKIIEDNNLVASNFSRSWIGTVWKIKSAVENHDVFPNISPTFINNCNRDNNEKWFTKANRSKFLNDGLIQTLGPKLEDLLECLVAPEPEETSVDEIEGSPVVKSEENSVQQSNKSTDGLTILDYNTAKIILDQIYSLGIAGELFVEFERVMKENNVLSIDESNDILRKIIDGSDAPFIYEKLGVRYENFLLDEFQDTSTVQWCNFSPLLSESLANDNSNLIVGDVKQSIYRWRGSDWRLLGNKVKDEFINLRHFAKSQISEETLEYNFRTTENIVTFNNALFRYFSKIMDDKLKREGFSDGTYINKIYSTEPSEFDQKVCPKMKAEDAYKGVVKATFIEKPKMPKDSEVSANDIYKLSVFKSIEDSINKILNNGGKLRDIAILVRTNLHGGEVAAYLLERGINVISGDSLDVKSSIAVRRIVSLLSLIESTTDGSHAKNQKYRDLNIYLCEDLGIDVAEFKNYHSILDLVEMIIRAIKEKSQKTGKNLSFEGQIPYLQAFEDEVKKWSESKTGDLGDFLEYWEGKNPKISSPTNVNAVQVVTVHKSKGLEFPYVILPFIESISLSGADQSWCVLDVEDSPLSQYTGVYSVNFSKTIMETYFRSDYIKDQNLQHVDNLNVVYVAMTRPVKGLHLIGELDGVNSKTGFIKALDGGTVPVLEKFTNFSRLLYYYFVKDSLEGNLKDNVDGSLESEGLKIDKNISEGLVASQTGPADAKAGTLNDNSDEDQIKFEIREFQMGALDKVDQDDSVERKENALELSSDYPSYSLNPQITKIDENGEEIVVGEQGRLKFSSDAIDYFSPEGGMGKEASRKQYGIVMHDILANVISVNDVPNAVQTAFLTGDINKEQKNTIESFLISKINSVSERGWFPEDASRVLNETSLLDSQGSNYRPDRVVKTETGQIIVIDYKFGDRSNKYLKQVRGYARLYKGMGYNDVKAYLWYVNEDIDEKTGEKSDGIVEVRLN